ncbi:Re/Si-specific NAD(P)(+) transhydrogenase subunit alpha [Fulvivirgaceae bacterium BMA12]|uniref:proton-translocating NAD(P)(+) transhydrogenase n=1 Tax=Agaribacillus aureus TaxID=3051825 RepID=A0ABT8L960_9BACT|nr:Re/Si-specific NAD(P)(+) transhydrogenase subunit alpha [Fulvivirgaceae bacterium BMA12]
MKIGVLKEMNDAKVAIIPDIAKKFIEENNQVLVETGAGHLASFDDRAFEEVGATIASREETLKEAEILITINPLEEGDYAKLKPGTVVVSLFQPFADPAVAEMLASHKLTAMSLDMIPRTTLAQAMDVLSSMASVAGYKAVVRAMDHLPRYFPMLTTAAGSIPPSKVLVIGAGVAGLQAVATCRRNGAVVEAFDTRLAAKEEVESLGAKFVEVEGATDDKGAGGYAVEQTEEYKQKQQALIQEKASKADVVITTAQLRGKPAPLLITEETVNNMKPGAVIVDLAASTGGNCALTKNDETVNQNGVTIIGDSNLSASMPMHASQLFSKNIQNYFKLFVKEGQLSLDFDNEIIKSSCIAFEGEVRYGLN